MMRWYLAEISIADLLNANVINEGSWHNVFGDKRKVSDIAELIRTVIFDAHHVPKIQEITQTIGQTSTMDETTVSIKDFKKAMNGKMIFLKNKKNEVSILEGNHRAVSLIMLVDRYNCDLSSVPNENNSWGFGEQKMYLVLNLHNTHTMKLGASYSLFDSEELLEYSIKSIRPNVDYISVVYQTVSNHGIPCNEGLVPLLNELKERGLIDELVLFEPDLNDMQGHHASIKETKKRNIGLEISRANGCDFHCSIDADEFYTDEQFKYMKDVMEDGYFDTGFCQHLQYYKDSIFRLATPEPEYVSTLERITPDTKYVFMQPTQVSIDPTRGTSNANKKCYIFSREECEMHHMSFVRKNIRGKLQSHSSRQFFTDELIEKVGSYYDSWVYPSPCMWAGGNLLDVIEVPRQFEIYKVA